MENVKLRSEKIKVIINQDCINSCLLSKALFSLLFNYQLSIFN